jgi:hypothetical protein
LGRHHVLKRPIRVLDGSGHIKIEKLGGGVAGSQPKGKDSAG